MTHHGVLVGKTGLGDLCAPPVRPCLAEIELSARRGWLLFPCKSGDKTPLVRWSTQATSDLAIIRQWNEKWPTCNWGVACGPDPGIWVLDVDGPNGAATIESLCLQYGGEWLNTLRVVTGKGYHLYYRYSREDRIQNSAKKLGLGLDVRGDGGYVLVPPSLHPSGRGYRWHESNLPIANTPAWLLAMASLSHRTPASVPKTQIGILVEGERNDGLMRLAGSLRRRGANAEQIEAELLTANLRRCKPPLDDDEVGKIAASAVRYPVGGPDPLETAWQIVQTGPYAQAVRYAQFLALASELQRARPGQPIALPVERIGRLMCCEPSLISRYRKRAEGQGHLTLVERHVPHRKGTLFFFNLDVQVGSVPTKPYK